MAKPSMPSGLSSTGKADGALLKAPKLHVFPSLSRATYETLVQTIERGGDFAIIDPLEPGYRLRFTNLSSPALVGICWCTWDPHFYLLPTASQSMLEYEVEIDSTSVAHGRQLPKRATPIAFREDPDYELPVFRRDQVNTFQKLIDRWDEWVWEPHSHRCGVERTTGAGDRRCVTIQSKGSGRTACYTRAIGRDYSDHRVLKGRYRVTAEVRTQAVSGSARRGVVCYNGPETKLCAEPAHQASYSRPVRGTQCLRSRRPGLFACPQCSPARSW